jgi:hypothetical protein
MARLGRIDALEITSAVWGEAACTRCLLVRELMTHLRHWQPEFAVMHNAAFLTVAW